MTLVMTFYCCCCSITNSCLNLCDFMSSSMPASSDFLDSIPNHHRCKEGLISWNLLKLKTCSVKKNVENKKTSHRLGENICKVTSDKSKCMKRCSVSYVIVVVTQSPGCVRLFATQRTAARQPSPSLTISCTLPKFLSIALVMPSSHLIL